MFLTNTFINKNGIIVVTNVRGVQNVANIYGYIRVSTKNQNEQRQLHKMMEQGVEEILIVHNINCSEKY